MSLDKGTQQAILEAAETEFMLKGYNGAKTTSIASTAGVTHSMLHYYFNTKENLFNRVFEDKLELMAQSIIGSFINSDKPILERIKSGIVAHFDFLVSNAELPRFVVNELISNPSRRSVMDKKISSIAGIFIAGLQSQLDVAAEQGLINSISAIDLLIDIASVNMLIFIALPLLNTFAVEMYGGQKAFFEARKCENIEIILSRLLKK